MTQSPLSINVKPYSVKDWPGCVAFLKQLTPTVVVVSIDQMDHFNRILEIQEALGQGTKIVARFIDEVHDGGMHLPPQATGDTRKYIVSPIDQLNRIKPFGVNGRTAYFANEPNGKASIDEKRRLVDHTCTAMDLAATRDFDMSLTILNWGAMHPLIIDGMLDPVLDPMLITLNRHRNRHYYGLHLYAPMDLLAELNALKKSCDKLKIPLPRIIVTEFGFDNDGTDSKNGFKTRDMSNESFAAWCISTCRMQLRSWLENGDVLGVATFIYGDDAKWQAFNVETGTHGEVSTAWRDVVLQSALVGDLNIKKRQTSEVPVVVLPPPTPPAPPPVVLPPPVTTQTVYTMTAAEREALLGYCLQITNLLIGLQKSAVNPTEKAA